MTEYGTIKIPRGEYERHNEQRKAAGLTWVEYLNEESAEIDAPEVDIGDTREAAKQAESNTEEIKRQLEAIQGAMV